MSRIQNILKEFNQRVIAERVAMAHYEARIRYTIQTSNGPRILDRSISEIFAVEWPLIMPPPEGSECLHMPRPV